jgi:uncharacterized protein involved in outer membrane biogenesis
MIKKLGILLAVLVILAAGGVWYVKTNLDMIIKNALEDYGSQATKTDVNIDKVKVSLATGEGRVEGINIGNPKSYVAAKAITVGDVTLKVDTNSITGSGPVIIKELTIEKPYITYEVGATGNSNLQDIQKNVAGYSPSKSSSSKQGRKVIIRDLYIRNGQVSATHALLKGKEVKTPLPLIHLRNIGKPGEGSTGAEVTKQVIGADGECRDQGRQLMR